MYILIDKARLAVLHKHSNRAVLVNLAHIECAGTSTILGLLNDKDTYSHLTMLDMKLLYENTTGSKLPGISLPSVVAALMQMFDRIPESDVVPSEVSAQAFAIPYKSNAHYKYVKGAATPTIPAGLFLPDTKQTVSDASDLVVASKYVAPPPPVEYVPAPPAPPAPPREPRSASAARVLPLGEGVALPPGGGTLIQRIYAFCDQQKAINDASPQPGTLDDVRKGCAKALIDTGVNPSTARRQTMEWMRSL